MEDTEVLAKANEIVQPHGLRAEFLGDENIKSVGVGGDFRTHTRVIVLIGPHPGWEVLAQLSTDIGNHTGINRITWELARKTEQKEGVA